MIGVYERSVHADVDTPLCALKDTRGRRGAGHRSLRGSTDLLRVGLGILRGVLFVQAAARKSVGFIWEG